MTTKVMASTSGMATATTMPARQPSDRKLTASTIAMASNKRPGEFADCLLDDLRLVGDEMRLDADRQVAVELGDSLLDVLAELQDVGALGPSRWQGRWPARR